MMMAMMEHGAARHEGMWRAAPCANAYTREREALDDAVQARRRCRRAPGRDEAISCVEALVCCVEAETCSAEAEDCSATAATSAMSPSARRASALIWCTAVAISPTRPVTSSTARPIASKASRVCSTVATPSAVRRPPSATTPTTFSVSAWISPISAGDLARGGLGLLGQLADLLGDDGEALALLAGAGGLDRGVEREQVGLLGQAGDRGHDAADLGGLGGEALHRGADVGGGLGDLADRVGGLRGGGDAALGDPVGLLAASAVAVADSALSAAARAASWTASRVDSTMRTWRSAPWATSVTAEAISSTARPASSEVDAICWEAEETVLAPVATSVSDLVELAAHRVVGVDRGLGLAEHRVEGRREAAELVRGGDLDRRRGGRERLREVARGDRVQAGRRGRSGRPRRGSSCGR